MLQGPVQELEIDTGITPPGSPGPLVVRREVGSLHNFSAGVSAAWRVFEFGASWVRTEAAEALERAAEAQADEQAEQIAYAVRAAYLAARFFQEVEAVTDKSLTLAGDELRQEEARRSAGLGSDLDLARVQMRVAELEAQLAQATQERERTLGTLRLLLGYAPNAPIELTDDLAGLGSASVPNGVDRQAHPLSRQVAAMHEAAEREHTRLGRTYFPTLDVMGSVKYQYPESPFANDQGGVLYSAGVLLTWNILDGDMIRRKRGEAEAQMGELGARALAADEEIDRQLTDARAKMRTAEAAVVTAERLLETADLYLKAADAALDAGAGTDLEKRKASERADQAQLALLKAYFDGALARADYLSAAGLGARGAGPRK
jgi:outer membrane protein TolC